MSRRPGWLYGWLLLLAVGLAGCGKKGQTYQEPTGYEGAAKRDPFLAAARYLKESGYTVASQSRFSRDHRRSATIIAPTEAFTNSRDSQMAVEWAAEGGHLILLLEGGEYWLDDWQSDVWTAIRTRRKDRTDPDRPAKDERLPMLKELRVSVNAVSALEETINVRRGEYRVRLSDQIEFDRSPPSNSPTLAVSSREAPSLYSYEYGGGRITLVANAHPFRNRYIGDLDHAGLLRALVELKSTHYITFLQAVRAKESDAMLPWEFLVKLWRQGWMALVTLAAIIAFWIWKNLARFGPAYAPEDRSARSFSENLLLSGAFLWRYRQTNSLLEPMRRELEAALLSRGWSLADPGVVEEIAKRTGLTPLRVQMASAGDLPSDGIGFQKLVQDLQLIRAKI